MLHHAPTELKHNANKHAEQNGLSLPFPENFPVDEKAAEESDDWYNKDAEKVATDKAAKMRSVQAQRHYDLVTYLYLQSAS